jgi:cytochrome b subunit of formate dehydrogenase
MGRTTVKFTSRMALYLAALLLLAGASSAAGKKPKLPTNDDCLACHQDASLSHDVNGKSVSLAVDPDKFKNSIHGGMFTCVDCHDDLKEATHSTTPKKVSCAKCHADSETAYQHSVHAGAIKAGGAIGDRAPTCVSCHGDAHQILPGLDANSKVFRANIPATCGSCHGQKFVSDAAGLSPTTVANYQQSVHGQAVKNGDTAHQIPGQLDHKTGTAAVCTDCHGNHEILPPKDPKSPIFKFNVPQTCGKCHADVAQQFVGSIHGQAIFKGNWQAPVCTDCHGIHTIKSHLDPKSSVAAANLAVATCGNCHEGVRLASEFGIAGGRTSTYLDSYHGLASKLGSSVVANCASCHGVHNILPSSDPHSTINPANLVATCGTCHPGAGQKFALSKVHINAPVSRDAASIGTYWVRRAYILIITLTLGGMLLHNLLIWRRKTLLRKAREARTVLRMTPRQRWQHAALLSSFFFLALSGFALKYPDSWMASLLGSSEAVRHIGHRIAAVVLLGVGFYHIIYCIVTREGRQLFLDFLPKLSDITDVRMTLLYYAGRSDQKPRYGRFSYADKFEYLALVWGTVLMGFTGLVLWFPVLISRVLPRWWLDIASALHFYEAILAVSAIFIWHFYFVIFDPDVYPINWAFWDGKISEHHLREHHARVYEELQHPAAEAETDTAAAPEPREEEPVAH